MTLFVLNKPITVLFGLALLMSVISFSPRAQAQGESQSSAQAQCFDILKENLAEAGIFAEPLATLSGQSYSDIEPLFGDTRKMLTSFDLTIDEPILGIRLYSFGDQTGYTHPPKSIMPIYTESDTWGDPVKEYVIAEEYVTDPLGKEHFLNCVFLHLDSETPLNVTQENYAYDGRAISLVKLASDENYKAWYNHAPGFDYDNNHFVTWKRLIVYPASTRNDYFNRYDVISAYPAKPVEDFSALSFFAGKDVTYEIQEDDSPAATYTTVDSVTGTTTKVELPPELLPPPLVGINFSYRLAGYYQAIESAFPEFGALLSMQGTLKYSTYKTLFTKPDITEEEQIFVSMLFTNIEDINTYYFPEGEGLDLESDKLIEILQNGDETLQKLAAGETLANLTAPNPVPLASEPKKSNIPFLLITILGVIGASVLVFILHRRKSISNSTTL